MSGATLDDVRASIAASAEGQAVIQVLCRSVLWRGAELAGLAGNTQALAH